MIRLWGRSIADFIFECCVFPLANLRFNDINEELDRETQAKEDARIRADIQAQLRRNLGKDA